MCEQCTNESLGDGLPDCSRTEPASLDGRVRTDEEITHFPNDSAARAAIANHQEIDPRRESPPLGMVSEAEANAMSELAFAAGISCGEAELAPLAARMTKGRKKYPNGCTVTSLQDEAGEVVHAINKYETEDRVRDELLDVAAVAMRLYLGEIDRGVTIDGLVQRRTDGATRSSPKGEKP